jgi:hypothetical protein
MKASHMDLNENMLRKAQASTIIALALNYKPDKNESSQEVIEHAIASAGPLSNDQNIILKNMLALAESIQDDEEPDESEEDVDDMISHINDWDDIADLYDEDELGVIDDETGEEVHKITESSELLEVLSRAERLKARIRFAKTANKRKLKIRVALKKHSSNATINKRARRMAVKVMETKLARGKSLSTLSVPEKMRIEKIIARKSKLVGRLALKLTSKIRNIERTRLTHSTYTKK